MQKKIRVLILEQDREAAEGLIAQLNSFFEVSHSDTARNLTDALELHIENIYHLCLLSDAISLKELETFIIDYRKLDREDACVFAQLRDYFEEDLDRESLSAQGFTTIVHRKLTEGDVNSLKAAFQAREHALEVNERIIDIEKNISLLLKEVDKLAHYQKRGRPAQSFHITPEFLRMQADFDQKTREKYFEALITSAQSGEAPIATRVVIPEEVLERRNFPGLTRDNYSGVSHRVWQKLLKRYGVKEQASSKTQPVLSDAKTPAEAEGLEQSSDTSIHDDLKGSSK